jgi:hypothetical protein
MRSQSVEDFYVDIVKRRVTHKSGIAFIFYPYPTERDWLNAGPNRVCIPANYDGDYSELARPAMKAAIAAGMRHYDL